MSKKQEAVAETAPAPEAVDIAPATVPEAPPVAAVAQEPAPEPPRYSERELGLVDEVGRALAPETREIRYSMRELWPAAIELGKQVGLGDWALFELARQFHAARPAGWRHELLDALNLRLADPTAGRTSEFRRHDLQPRIDAAWNNLEVVIGRMPAENQLKVLGLLLKHLATIR